jgi:hypothetical protein
VSKESTLIVTTASVVFFTGENKIRTSEKLKHAKSNLTKAVWSFFCNYIIMNNIKQNCFILVLMTTVSIWGGHDAQAQLALSPQHDQTAAHFKAQQFKSNGVYDTAKIAVFVDRLEKEKIALLNEMYETKIIEKIDLEIDEHKDAIKSAKKELDEKKSKYAQAFNDYLIPKMKELSHCAVKINLKTATDSECDIIADDFIIGYSGFYLPEAPRRWFHQDLDYLFAARSTFGFNFHRHSDKVEAVNLLVETENLALTQKCVPEIKLNDILNQNQIKRLKKCNVDLSIYNPSGESLWRKLSPVEFAKAKNRHEDWFPREDEKIKFKQIKFSSAGSPKMEGEFERDGDEIEVKIKMGIETHTEIVTSMLGKMLGMYQDTSVHRKTVKVYLPKKMTPDAFRAQWSRKYSGLNRNYLSFIHSYGKDNEGYWVLLKDVQLSINDPKFLRIGPYDPSGWDLPNRREQRAQILWFGLVNMIDAKSGNHLLAYEKTDKGLVPRYSLQDVGYSLHYQFHMNLGGLSHMVNSVLAWGVNTYSDTFLKWDDDKVHIWWSDAMLNRGRFKSTTYSDVKWMARQIARLTDEDIAYAVKSSNYPAEIEDLYIKKISARRNEVVRAFRLENEFPIYTVPDMKTYNPNKKVKNGKIVVSQFEGYASYELPRTTFLSLILQGIGNFGRFKTLNDQFTARVGTQLGLAGDVAPNIEVKNLNIMPGVHVEINRSVSINNQYVANEGQAQGFAIRDRVAIEINVGSEMFKTLKGLFPDELSANVNIKAWRREFELVHFADSVVAGYKAPFKLFNFVSGWKECVVKCLSRGDVFKISDSYGVSVSGKAPLGAIIGIPVSVGAGVFWQSSMPTYFAKNQYNHLTIYQVKNTTTRFSGSIGLDPLNLFLFNLPILELSGSKTYYTHDSSLYRFTPSTSDENFNILTQEHDKSELELLNRYLSSGDEDGLILNKKEMEITAKGKKTQASLGFLLFWKKSKSTGSAKTTVKTSNREVRNFITYTGKKEASKGIDRSILIIDSHATVVEKENVCIGIEMDEKQPDHIAAFIEMWNYDRKLDRAHLVKYINNMNTLYSKSTAEPFYKDYYLPPQEEINRYIKVFGHTRLYFYGDSLVTKLKLMNEKQLEQLYKTHAKEKRSLNAFRHALADLKKHAKKDEEYLKLYYKLINSLHLNENGVGLVKSLIDEKDFFVMGEIYGVYPSFSTIQQNEAVAGRRFAGKSWGNYRIPPLRDFLHNHVLNNESIYVNGEINFEDFFGPMPGGELDFY